MHSIRTIVFLFGLLVSSLAQGQTAAPPPPDDSLQGKLWNSWGLDILISTGGVGLGAFYRHEFSRDISGFVMLSVSESKDDREMDYVDAYGNIFTPGKINRFLIIPLMIGVQHRLFSNQILENFRPYVSAAAGPTMIYTAPYNEEFFTALGKGQPRYTVGGYIGAGSYFGNDRSTLFGLSIRYYFVPFGPGIESFQPDRFRSDVNRKKEFGGFFITLNFGSSW
jgi:hypothetical protein